MDEQLFLSIIRVFGERLYHLHVGFAAMFNLLSVEHHIFSQDQFHREREKVESYPDLLALRGFLEKLSGPTVQEAIETFLREYKGPVQ